MVVQDAIELSKIGRQIKSSRTIGGKTDREIGRAGLREVGGIQVDERIVLEASRIDTLAYQSSFNPEKGTGNVPVNLSLFSREDFRRALKLMGRTFRVGLGIGNLVALTGEGERWGDMTIPQSKVGLITVSQIVVKGLLLKAGIPMDARFGGILQIRKGEPLRFVDLIKYTSSSFDPSEMFVAAGMTSVNKATSDGNGKILASFWEIPASARPEAEVMMQKLEMRGMKGLLKLGKEGETVCETPVKLGRVGMILIDGLNPVAATFEAGIAVINYAISGLTAFKELRSFSGGVCEQR